MTEHKLFVSESQTSATAMLMRYRAFCRCGWYGPPTSEREAMQRGFDEHVAQDAVQSEAER